MYSGDHNLLDLYGKIGSSKLTERASALNDLKHVLSTRRTMSLDAKGWSKMFEVLYKLVNAERSTYLKGNKRKIYAERLSTAGYCLRLAVEAGVSKIRSKAFKSLVNHIIDTLSVSDGELLEPVSLDYLKMLSACLAHASHIEHLIADEWLRIADFCRTNLEIQLVLDELPEDSGEATPARKSILVRNDSDVSRRSGSVAVAPPRLTFQSEELLECLRHLLSSGNAPILAHSREITEVLLGFLRVQTSITRAHQTVFASLNSIVSVISTNKLDMMSRVISAVLPIIARFWDTKLPGLREEMIVFLIQCGPQLRADVMRSTGKALRRAVEDLWDILFSEYIARADRDILQLDDITFPCPNNPNALQRSILSLNVISLRPSLRDYRHEPIWAVLYLIAMLVEILDRSADDLMSRRRTDSGSSPVKRQRLSNHLDELIHYIRSSHAPRKISALQVMSFIADLGGIHDDAYPVILQDLYDACSDNNPIIASWALISLGSCAFLNSAKDQARTPMWEQIWRLASRYSASHQKCRAACHLMHILLAKNIIPYSLVTKDVDNILLTIDLNGPAQLADSSLSLWRLIVERRSMVPQSSRLHAGDRLIQWFSSKWRPADGFDRTGGTFYTHYQPHHVSTIELINFLLTCFGAKILQIETNPQQFCGVLGRTFLRMSQLHELHGILLNSLDENTNLADTTPISRDTSARIARSQIVEKQLIDLFESQLTQVHDKWQSIASANIQQVTEAIMRNFVGFVLVLSIVCSRMGSDLDRVASLKKRLTETLISDLVAYLRHKDCTKKQIDGLLLSLAEILPTPTKLITSAEAGELVFALSGDIATLLVHVSDELESRALQDSQTATQPDFMDIDEGFSAFDAPENEVVTLPREPYQALCSPDAFRVSMTGIIKLCSLCSRSTELGENCIEFMEYLQSIPLISLIMMKPLVMDFLGAVAEVLPDEPAKTLFEFFGDNLIQKYELERCETSIGFCVDALGVAASLWVTEKSVDEHPETEEVCMQIFAHMVKIALQMHITSQSVRVSVINIIQHILKLNANFEGDDTLMEGDREENTPIPLLLSRLGDPDVRVSFAVAKNLPSIFALYKPSTYRKFCDLAEKHMPQELVWREGLAMRIYTIGQLAQANPSSIARMVFRIFETAQFPDGEIYSRRALVTIAKAAGLQNEQELFVLFSSKLIWVWVDFYESSDFPYKAFGYQTLKDMCLAVKEELFAQLLARGKNKLAEHLANIVEIPLDELIVQAFSKIVAYGIAFAIWADMKSKKSKGQQPVEAASSKEKEKPTPADVRVRKRLGTDRYYELVKRCFRSIVATFFEIMYVDPKNTEDVGNADFLNNVNRNLEELVPKDTLNWGLVVDPLMPYFRVKIVLQALGQFLRKGDDGIVSRSLWTPAMVTFVARRLFTFLHPAWGSAHAVAMIRNIRLLVAMADNTAIWGYPLEMLLHGLKTSVLDDMCVQDTIGIMQYLLTKGQDYLSRRPTFVLGLYLSLLASIRQKTSSDSNLDDITASIGIKAATEFHTWFAEYLKARPFGTGQNDALFRGIVNLASKFGYRGSARPGTYESGLLILLLEDEKQLPSNRLLDDVSRRAAFELCGSSFERPKTFRDDVFGDDSDSEKHSSSLLRICQKMPVNEGFLQWSARVLGRTYASTGHVPEEWTKEIEFTHHRDLYSPKEPGRAIDVIPKVTILTRLRELLLSNDNKVVGDAEETFQRIIFDESQMRHQPELTHALVLHSDESSALQWLETPASGLKIEQVPSILTYANPEVIAKPSWIKDLVLSMCINFHNDPVLGNLLPLLRSVDGLAEELFPYITHIQLLSEVNVAKNQRQEISEVFATALSCCDDTTIEQNTLVIKCILYLRTQESYEEIRKAGSRGPQPTKWSREFWLDINYLEAARAASKCRMFKSAWLFAEIYDHIREDNEEPVPGDLLLTIFENVDDPDSYYGVNQESNLQTVLKKFEYEGDGWKALSHHGANLETLSRTRNNEDVEDLGIVDAFSRLGMNGLAHSFLQNGAGGTASDDTAERMFKSAWKLEQWDLPCVETSNLPSATIYKALQSVNTIADSRSASVHVDPPFVDVMKKMTTGVQTSRTLGQSMRTLAMLTEMEEVLTSNGQQELEAVEKRLRIRNKWMHTGRYLDVEELMAMRQATFGSLAKQLHLQAATHTNISVARFMEAQSLVGVCKMARSHKVLQQALSAATQLSKVVQSCASAGNNVKAVATLQAANVLWEEGQSVAAVRMLQSLGKNDSTATQSIPVGKAKILAKLGRWTSDARLEEPGKIMSDYLEKSIQELRHQEVGPDAGRVFHEFASFCDQQLENAVDLEDFQRAMKLRQQKEQEIMELTQLINDARAAKKASNVDAYSKSRERAKTWLDLDTAEFNRLKRNREAFLEKSVLNYLRSLAASDEYDHDAVRFCSLWLKNLMDPRVNDAAAAKIEDVASRKFVALMNQLSSRLSDTGDLFQKLLQTLMVRICRDHPYHGIYQILALTKIRSRDHVSTSRLQAALKVADTLKAIPKTAHTIHALEASCFAYQRLAGAKIPANRPKDKPLSIHHFGLSAQRVRVFEKDIPDSKIPPPTLHIEIRKDCDYHHLPCIFSIMPEVAIAGGISAPKIIKERGTDGKIYKMLVKGGSDDLRQDAIMLQVFDQVSELLLKNRNTRQRDLKVRTYKVVPLTTGAGIIEFVPNTIPLHEYLLPAHSAYYPKDWQHTECRKRISAAQQEKKSREIRVREFEKCMEHFHPVMKFFFMHCFNGPDEWYASRLAYTRTTAAISMLGYILGLGDRHGHNILLDNMTGEVVHIDLGVAFEQGRILPVPEVVPFRLTRDIVDGMGITGVEGVFRRCCEFTLQVLRNEAFNITTILDVLRYDPLYSWTVSPLRLKRMQDAAYDNPTGEQSLHAPMKPKDETESEADRALMVVSRKLSSTLSVSATVNELIQQASDVKNLAVLYAGWAAYA